MNQIVDASQLVGDEVDTPETTLSISQLVIVKYRCKDLPCVTVAGRETHEAVCETVIVNKRAELAA